MYFVVTNFVFIFLFSCQFISVLFFYIFLTTMFETMCLTVMCGSIFILTRFLSFLEPGLKNDTFLVVLFFCTTFLLVIFLAHSVSCHQYLSKRTTDRFTYGFNFSYENSPLFFFRFCFLFPEIYIIFFQSHFLLYNLYTLE